MTFEKQVKNAKEKQLQNRIIRDAIFIILGIVFLIISIFSAYNNSDKKNDKKEDNKIQVTKKN